MTKRHLIVAIVLGVIGWLFMQAPTAQDERAVISLAMFLLGYCLPWIVAAHRNHHNMAAIAVLNILLGWTLIGWVVALVWACTAVRAPEHVLDDPRESRGDITIGWQPRKRPGFSDAHH